MIKLSVVLATRNEEQNIERCLRSIKDIADEIIIFDEHSTDNTVNIAKKYGAKVFDTVHEPIFHVTKQKAIDAAHGEWILQLDADEVVTEQLANEIKRVMTLSNDEIEKRKPENEYLERLFSRHLSLLSTHGEFNTDPDANVVAFFIPRINMFLGHPLIHGGVYPDGVIRFFKKGKAYLPAKSVHEQMKVEGKVSWLFNALEHWDSPTLYRYVQRLNRYTDLQAVNISENQKGFSVIPFLRFTIIYPVKTFIDRFVLHRGYKDGMYGFVWAVFSAWHFPIAYYKFITKSKI